MMRLISPINIESPNNRKVEHDNVVSVQLPGSKYIANRLLPLCALASTPSRLSNIVDNDDINTATKGLKALGYQLTSEKDELVVSPRTNWKQQVSQVEFNAHHSGTFSRFVTAISALETIPVKINCSEKMATRPMNELFNALRELGVTIKSENDKLPAIITGPISHYECQLDASRSSQYLSALLIIAPLLENGLSINLLGKQVSNAYVDMTVNLMEKMKVVVKREDQKLTVEAGQVYHGLDYCIPCDPVSSSYFMGLAAITGQKIRIDAFDHHSLQGESKFYQVLEKMGVEFIADDTSLTIVSNGELKGVEVDMGEMPDAVQTLAVVASYAKGRTLIKNIAHLAYKESNRIKDTATELTKAGIAVEAGDDYLLITGGQPKAVEVETYDDHRMAMSMALLGAKTKGVVIKDSAVVNKSFPTYWKLMQQVGLSSNLINSDHETMEDREDA